MASFKLTSKDGEWPLSPGGNLVGCADHCGVRVEAPNVAGEHARVDVVADRVLLTDLDSETGTFLDDVLVRGTVPLEVGQTLRVGSKPLRLKRIPAENGRLSRAPLRRAARVGLKLALGALAALVVFLVVLSLIFNADRLRRDVVKAIESTVDRDAGGRSSVTSSSTISRSSGRSRSSRPRASPPASTPGVTWAASEPDSARRSPSSGRWCSSSGTSEATGTWAISSAAWSGSCSRPARTFHGTALTRGLSFTCAHAM